VLAFEACAFGLVLLTSVIIASKVVERSNKR